MLFLTLAGRMYAGGMPGKGTRATIEQLRASPHKERLSTGSIMCSASNFGGDPMPGYNKACFCHRSNCPASHPNMEHYGGKRGDMCWTVKRNAWTCPTTCAKVGRFPYCVRPGPGETPSTKSARQTNPSSPSSDSSQSLSTCSSLPLVSGRSNVAC